jgi:exonuclease VII small subunit
VSFALNIVAGIEKQRGNLDAALAKYQESLEIRRALESELGTPGSRRDVSLSLDNVAGIERGRGNLDAALASYEEALEVRRELAAELGTPESRRDVSFSLDNVAGIEKQRGALDAALAKYQESLEIRRALESELGTPGSRRDVSLSLDRVADIEEAHGNLDGALAKYQESLEIRLELVGSATEPIGCEMAATDQNGLAWPAVCIARIHHELGDVAACDAALERARSWIQALEHPDVGNANLLDTAATYYETKAKAAASAGDQERTKAAMKAAEALRARIAAL